MQLLIFCIFLASILIVFFIWWGYARNTSDDVITFAINVIFFQLRAFSKVAGIIFLLLLFITLSSAGCLLWAEKNHLASLPNEKISLMEKSSIINDYGDSLYLTWISLTTIGFGDLAPKSPAGKAICIINSLISVFIIGGLIVSIVSIAIEPLKPEFNFSKEEYEAKFKITKTETESNEHEDHQD